MSSLVTVFSEGPAKLPCMLQFSLITAYLPSFYQIKEPAVKDGPPKLVEYVAIIVDEVGKMAKLTIPSGEYQKLWKIAQKTDFNTLFVLTDVTKQPVKAGYEIKALATDGHSDFFFKATRNSQLGASKGEHIHPRHPVAGGIGRASRPWGYEIAKVVDVVNSLCDSVRPKIVYSAVCLDGVRRTFTEFAGPNRVHSHILSSGDVGAFANFTFNAQYESFTNGTYSFVESRPVGRSMDEAFAVASKLTAKSHQETAIYAAPSLPEGFCFVDSADRASSVAQEEEGHKPIIPRGTKREKKTREDA